MGAPQTRIDEESPSSDVFDVWINTIATGDCAWRIFGDHVTRLFRGSRTGISHVETLDEWTRCGRTVIVYTSK